MCTIRIKYIITGGGTCTTGFYLILRAYPLTVFVLHPYKTDSSLESSCLEKKISSSPFLWADGYPDAFLQTIQRSATVHCIWCFRP